jgi:hypothetical protein
VRSPRRGRPAASRFVVQYAASSKLFTTGSAIMQAARVRMPLPGCPQRRSSRHPCTVRVSDRVRRRRSAIAVRNERVAPMMTPCTTPDCASHVANMVAD